MFLRSLIKNKLVTINYYKEGTLYKCTGHVQGLNLAEQTLSLKDQQEKILSIRLSKIMKIS
ncbi:YolD-like family protein [Ectobacillus funiculus]|uniref:YolD-like family protein n=1 Tax=Ectobacillus funiculus TaxID=137993 RepID=UPI00101C61B8|nr:YolD-like family protein [Ectobacillus funiculus]